MLCTLLAGAPFLSTLIPLRRSGAPLPESWKCYRPCITQTWCLSWRASGLMASCTWCLSSWTEPSFTIWKRCHMASPMKLWNPTCFSWSMLSNSCTKTRSAYHAGLHITCVSLPLAACNQPQSCGNYVAADAGHHHKPSGNRFHWKTRDCLAKCQRQHPHNAMLSHCSCPAVLHHKASLLSCPHD